MRGYGKKRFLSAVVCVVGAICFAVSCGAATIEQSLDIFEQGKRAYSRDEFDTAVGYFKEALQDVPENAMTEVTMYYLARSYLKAGRKEMAEKAYGRLLDKFGSGKWAAWARQDMKNAGI